MLKIGFINVRYIFKPFFRTFLFLNGYNIYGLCITFVTKGLKIPFHEVQLKNNDEVVTLRMLDGTLVFKEVGSLGIFVL